MESARALRRVLRPFVHGSLVDEYSSLYRVWRRERSHLEERHRVMMLRSSSTPVLGSLLSSSSSLHISSQCSDHHHHSSPNPDHHSFACHLSPASDGFRDQSPSHGIPRSRSDGNLRSFLSDHHPPSPKCPSQHPHTTLETILSFSVYIRKTLAEEEAVEKQDDDENDGQRVDGRFDFASENRTGSASTSGPPPSPLFLARGLGIDRIGSGLLTAGGGGVGICDVPMGNGGEQSDVETHYKRLLEENPSNALFLRDYAEFLYQAKGDVKRAEEYYSRAILADPDDGESLSQYARLVWELHHDEERASSYFQQAVQAAPRDRQIIHEPSPIQLYTELKLIFPAAMFLLHMLSSCGTQRRTMMEKEAQKVMDRKIPPCDRLLTLHDCLTWSSM